MYTCQNDMRVAPASPISLFVSVKQCLSLSFFSPHLFVIHPNSFWPSSYTSPSFVLLLDCFFLISFAALYLSTLRFSAAMADPLRSQDGPQLIGSKGVGSPGFDPFTHDPTSFPLTTTPIIEDVIMPVDAVYQPPTPLPHTMTRVVKDQHIPVVTLQEPTPETTEFDVVEMDQFNADGRRSPNNPDIKRAVPLTDEPGLKPQTRRQRAKACFVPCCVAILGLMGIAALVTLIFCLLSANGRNSHPPVPRPNTSLAAVTVYSNDQNNASFITLFYQDTDLYICAKTSSNGPDDWDLSFPGVRILQAPAMNGTPIAAVSAPNAGQIDGGSLPIHVFFISSDGYLVDFVQEIYGKEWVQGSLWSRQYKPAALTITNHGTSSNMSSLAAVWCHMDQPIIFVQGADLELAAFKLDGGVNNTWSLMGDSLGGNQSYGDTTNFATTCIPGDTISPELFVNRFGMDETVGSVQAFYNDSMYSPLSHPCY